MIYEPETREQTQTCDVINMVYLVPLHRQWMGEWLCGLSFYTQMSFYSQLVSSALNWNVYLSPEQGLWLKKNHNHPRTVPIYSIIRLKLKNRPKLY